jgi:indolepyruvate ferredoxin oxidoreductase, beta subunit
MARLAKHFHIAYDKWIAAIENTVAPKFIEMNKKAFELGYNCN